MQQKNGFDRFPEFKSKGIEFEVGDKYLFRQLTSLLIRQSCQACSSKPLRDSIMKDIQLESAILVESRGLLIRV
jgi:hypothetical protein